MSQNQKITCRHITPSERTTILPTSFEFTHHSGLPIVLARPVNFKTSHKMHQNTQFPEYKFKLVGALEEIPLPTPTRRCGPSAAATARSLLPPKASLQHPLDC